MFYKFIILLIIPFSINWAQGQYKEGDYISDSHQKISYLVCNGDNNYSDDDSLSLAKFNGDLNGGNYKVLMLDIVATW